MVNVDGHADNFDGGVVVVGGHVDDVGGGVIIVLVLVVAVNTGGDGWW